MLKFTNTSELAGKWWPVCHSSWANVKHARSDQSFQYWDGAGELEWQSGGDDKGTGTVLHRGEQQVRGNAEVASPAGSHSYFYKVLLQPEDKSKDYIVNGPIMTVYQVVPGIIRWGLGELTSEWWAREDTNHDFAKKVCAEAASGTMKWPSSSSTTKTLSTSTKPRTRQRGEQQESTKSTGSSRTAVATGGFDNARARAGHQIQRQHAAA